MAVPNLVEYAKVSNNVRICMLATVNGPLPGEAECQDDLFVYELMPMTFDEFLKAGKGVNSGNISRTRDWKDCRKRYAKA